ncbi:hypothetical protein F2Q69_00060293 [Brassica cretica]|uniref:Aspartic peptidase DDI1-type domain-containing protein n=1 Tax=Brassica cretica TaxID=69181 RepID=A0A8S9RPH4_BRACR|nr:hypothetical protein F2Q69_00060293 [Brassica cretica]
MPSSTRSNKETQLLFSTDPTSLERSICKGRRSSSTDNNTSSSIDSRQPPSTPTPISSTNTPFPPSTEDTLLSTDIFHPISIDTSVRTSIDTELRDMVATLILVRDEKGDLHDQESHLHDDFWQVVKQEKLQEGDFEVESSMSFGGSRGIDRRRTLNIGRQSKTPTSAHHVYVTIDRYSHTAVDRQKETAIDRQNSAPIDQRALLTYRVQMPKAINTPSDDAADPMEVDRVFMGRTVRKRKEKVPKHLKRRANEKERESFQKRVFRIPLEKPFEEAYFTHRLWMFFRKTKETEEDIRRMFCEAREKMKKRITLKKESDPGKFAILCTVKGIEFPHVLCDTGASVSILPRVMAGHLGLQVEPSKESLIFVDCFQRSSGGIVRDLEVQIGNALVLIDFHVLDIKLNWNSSLLLGRAFLSTVGAVCNMQTNQLCLTLIDPHIHYNPIPVKKPQTSSKGIDDPGLIASCHCGAEYETEYSASIETHTATSIDSAHKKSIDTPKEESIDTSPNDWENKYYNPTMAAHTKDTMHAKDYEEERVTDRKRASTDIAYYPSIDTKFDRVREGDYSIGIWADDYHHESYAVETEIHEPGVDEPYEGFTYEELLNMQRRDEAEQYQSESTQERTCFSHPIDRANRPSIDNNLPSSIDICPKPPSTVSKIPNYDNQYLTPDEFGIFRDPDGYATAIDGHALQVSREDIANILQMANGADNLFVQQRTVPAHQQRPEFGRRAFDLFGTRKFYWEEKDGYGVYTDDRGYARDVDEDIINVSKDDIRKLMERDSRDEHNYICLPEHASSFTQTKLVLEIYTKDEIIEMFYGVCGAQEKNEGDFQMKLNGVYYPMNDSISWLTTCMEEMRQDIAKIQHAADKHRAASIDRHHSTSIDDDPKNSHPIKFQSDFHTRAEIDQLIEEIYRTLETTDERLDRRCDDIYFSMDLSMSALTSQIEAMQRSDLGINDDFGAFWRYLEQAPEMTIELDHRPIFWSLSMSALTSQIEAIQREIVEIHRYITRRPEPSTSIDRRDRPWI